MIVTYPMGEKIDLSVGLRPSQVHIHDIAHALSLICRYGGHCREHYSVAQHSCALANSLQWTEEYDWNNRKRLATIALFHDASEAYIGDIIKDVKHNSRVTGLVQLETEIQAIIYKRFGLAPTPQDLKTIKHKELVLVAREMFSFCFTCLEVPVECEKAIMVPLSPSEAKRLFLELYSKLVIKVD